MKEPDWVWLLPVVGTVVTMVGGAWATLWIISYLKASVMVAMDHLNQQMVEIGKVRELVTNHGDRLAKIEGFCSSQHGRD